MENALNRKRQNILVGFLQMGARGTAADVRVAAGRGTSQGWWLVEELIDLGLMRRPKRNCYVLTAAGRKLAKELLAAAANKRRS